MILAELPELRKDEEMMRAYMFLMDFLEVVSKETAARLKANQLIMQTRYGECIFSGCIQ